MNKNLIVSILKIKDKTLFPFWQHFLLTFLTTSRVGQKKKKMDKKMKHNLVKNPGGNSGGYSTKSPGLKITSPAL